MFSVIFEVQPHPAQWDAYLGAARMLRPELERIAGFVDNVRYRSLARAGWILSLSAWRDEKSLVRWRTQAAHHDVQRQGRDGLLLHYHLRIGQVTHDTHLPEGHALREQRLDETEVGGGTAVTLLAAASTPEALAAMTPAQVAHGLGLDTEATGLVAWDVFDAVLTPGDVIALATWRDADSASAFARRSAPPAPATRLRQVRVVRDYGMFDRREAPQYYPQAVRR